jgi:hypothetical protein
MRVRACDARARARTRPRASGRQACKQAGMPACQTSACCKRYKKSLLTLKLSHTCARDGDLAIGTIL